MKNKFKEFLNEFLNDEDREIKFISINGIENENPINFIDVDRLVSTNKGDNKLNDGGYYYDILDLFGCKDEDVDLNRLIGVFSNLVDYTSEYLSHEVDLESMKRNDWFKVYFSDKNKSNLAICFKVKEAKKEIFLIDIKSFLNEAIVGNVITYIVKALGFQEK